MPKPTVMKFNEFAPLLIQRYERYLPNAFDGSMTMLEKVNNVIEYANQIGHISNDVVQQWNTVADWLMDEGLDISVDQKLNGMAKDNTIKNLINDKIFNDLNSRVANKVDAQTLQSTLTNLATGSPKGVYATVAALEAAHPSGNNNVYIVGTDWYYWNGTKWTNGGVYQATAVQKQSVDFTKLHPSATDVLRDTIDPINFYDPTHPENVKGYVINSTGQLVALSSTYTTHKIYVIPGEKWTMRMAQTTYGAFYDRSGAFVQKIGTDGTTVSPFTFTVPENALYMRVNGAVTNMNSDMVVKGTTYPDKYVPPTKKLKNDVELNSRQLFQIEKQLKETEIPVDSLSSILDVNRSPNLLDPSKRKTGYILNVRDEEVALEGYSITHYIPVKNGDVIRFGHDTAMGTNAVLQVYDQFKTRIKSMDGPVDSGGFKTVTIDEPEAAFIRTSYKDDRYLGTLMIVKNQPYPKNYEPFYERIYLNSNIAGGGGGSDEGKLSGKVLVNTGDSIANGEYATGGGGYAKIIGYRNSMTVQNLARSGGTLVSGTETAAGVKRFWINESPAAMRDDADYILMEGGVNDTSLNIPLGTVSTNYVGPYDNTTICGALETLFKDTIAKFPGTAKMGYIIVHKIFADGTYWDKDVYPALKKICKKWGMPCLDLTEEIPPLNFIPHLKTQYTQNGDGWHPNEEGFRKFYVDKVEAWMKTL